MILSLKIFLFISFISNCIYSILANDKAGVKIAANQAMIVDFQRKILPSLLEKIGKIDLPDQSINLDAKIGTLHIYLTQIHFLITNLLQENISVNFGEPSNIIISASQISGSGKLNTKFKLGFISETDNVDVRINRVDIQVTFTLGTTESHLVPGKHIPTASISNINTYIDIDFDIHGTVIATIVDLVKGKIRSLINSQIQTILQNNIKDLVNNMIKEAVDKLPVYVPIGQFDLAVDYSLVSPPKVLDNFLIINSNGAVVNVNNTESLINPYEMPDNLPDYDKAGKLAQVFASDYSINTAFRTLHLTNLLKIKVTSSDIPLDSPVQLNTTSLDLIIFGISDVYGKDKLVNIECGTSGEPPKFKLLENEAIGSVVGECSIFVQVDNSTLYDKALTFNTTITANANANMTEGGNITAIINKIHLENTEMVFSKVPKVNIKVLETLINFSSNIIVPFINSKYLKYFTVSLPSYKGVFFNDSKVEIQNNYFELNLTPKVTFGKNIKKIKKTNQEFIALQSIYLGY